MGEEEQQSIDLAARACREKGIDPNKWTNDEWANGEADRLAGQAWGDEFSHIQNQANALRFWHPGGIQVITSKGSIAGQIPKRLPKLLIQFNGQPIDSQQ